MRESKTLPTPCPELNAVLQELTDSVQTVLGNTFVAACLQGSFAVGGFDRHSDVDFIVAIEYDKVTYDMIFVTSPFTRFAYNWNCGKIYNLNERYKFVILSLFVFLNIFLKLSFRRLK